MPPTNPQHPNTPGPPIVKTMFAGERGERGERVVSEGESAIKDFLAREGGSFAKFDASPEDKLESRPAKEPESATALGAQKTELDYAIETLEDSAELTYAEKLEKHKLTPEEAAAIVDSIMEKGYYEKTYPITKRHSVTFRTRLAQDLEKLWFEVEDANPRLPATISATIARINMSVSMAAFRGIDLREKDTRERMAIIRKMPETVFRIVALKLGKFDRMIEDVLDEGAIQNF